MISVIVVKAMVFRGLREASGGAFLDKRYFVVASDESNVFRIFDLEDPDEIGRAVDLTGFLGAQQSDIEAGAKLKDRIFWITSHTPDNAGNVKRERQLFFSTTAQAAGLAGADTVIEDLRGPLSVLLKARKFDATRLNVEGLAAAAKERLLIGLRDPVTPKGKAILVPLRNPVGMVASGEAPDLGEPILLGLNGGGIRDIVRRGSGDEASYVILSSPPLKGGRFGLWTWTGSREAEPRKVPLEFEVDFHPEAVLRIPGTNDILILSDDGKLGPTSDPPEKQTFRAFQLRLSETA